MRIRKHSKLITPSFIVCQLNRSPWDVDDHSFSLQDNENNLPQLRHFSSDSGGESMELSFEYVEQKSPPPPPPPPEPPLDETNRWHWQHIHHQLKPPPLRIIGPSTTLPPIPKKRGRPKKPNPTTTTTTTTTTTNNIKPREGISYSDSNSNGNSNADQLCGSSASMNHIWDDNEDDNGVEMVDEEIDYIEDEFDDDDEDNGDGRRVRKPVKARSLKSLL